MAPTNFGSATPVQPEVNPYEGAKSNLVHSRNAAKKLGGVLLTDLHSIVQSGHVINADLKPLMLDSLRRVEGLREFLIHLNRMTEQVYVRSLAASKG